MKHYLGLAVGMVAGFAIGVGTVGGINAQGKASVYLVTEIDVTNPEAYGKEFAPLAQAAIKNSGGKFVVIGGAGGASAKPITGIVGTPPKRVAIQAWESLDAIKAWYNGAEYQAALKIGEKYATFRRYAVEGQ